MLILIFILLAVTTDCSVIGYKLARERDAKKAAGVINTWGIAHIDDGVSIRIEQDNNDSLTGEYIGIGELQRVEYEEHYGRLKASSPDLAFLPDIGDAITIVDKSDNRMDLEFYSIYVMYDGTIWVPHISGRPLEEGVSGNQKLDSIKILFDKKGNGIDINALKLLIYECKVPLSSAVLVRVGEASHAVSMDQIKTVEILSKKSRALYGFMAGLALDIVFGYFLYTAINAIADMNWE